MRAVREDESSRLKERFVGDSTRLAHINTVRLHREAISPHAWSRYVPRTIHVLAGDEWLRSSEHVALMLGSDMYRRTIVRTRYACTSGCLHVVPVIPQTTRKNTPLKETARLTSSGCTGVKISVASEDAKSKRNVSNDGITLLAR